VEDLLGPEDRVDGWHMLVNPGKARGHPRSGAPRTAPRSTHDNRDHDGRIAVAGRRAAARGHDHAGTITLWLLVIFVGIQFGAGLYEKLAIVPLWAEVPGDQVLDQIQTSGMYRAGRAFWPFVSVPVAILAVLNLVLAWRSKAPERRWWLTGAALMCGYAVASYGFFVPSMLALQSSGASWPAAEIESLVSLWTALNWGRMVVGAAGWLCALRALSLSHLGAWRPGLPATAKD